MLILTRRPGETIHIGDDTEVTILGILRQPSSGWYQST